MLGISSARRTRAGMSHGRRGRGGRSWRRDCIGALDNDQKCYLQPNHGSMLYLHVYLLPKQSARRICDGYLRNRVGMRAGGHRHPPGACKVTPKPLRTSGS